MIGPCTVQWIIGSDDEKIFLLYGEKLKFCVSGTKLDSIKFSIKKSELMWWVNSFWKFLFFRRPLARARCCCCGERSMSWHVEKVKVNVAFFSVQFSGELWSPKTVSHCRKKLKICVELLSSLLVERYQKDTAESDSRDGRLKIKLEQIACFFYLSFLSLIFGGIHLTKFHCYILQHGSGRLDWSTSRRISHSFTFLVVFHEILLVSLLLLLCALFYHFRRKLSSSHLAQSETHSSFKLLCSRIDSNCATQSTRAANIINGEVK